MPSNNCLKPFCLCLVSLALSCGGAVAAEPSKSLPRSAPEEQGISSKALQEFVEAADQQIDSMHSLMLVRHGHVVAEGWWTPYSAESPHVLFSLSKSFTSTAVGLAIAEGKLSLDDEVLKFFPDEAPAEPSKNLQSMRVRDLLCMSTGHSEEPKWREQKELTWTKFFLAQPVAFKPGTHFLYNTPATYMQSAIVQKVTGQTVLDYLRPRLFEPLGIENPTWGTSPQGISLGGYGLNIRTEDIAKFGQLYLQKGQWNGKQLVAAEWIAAATSKQTSNGSNPKSDWDQGYGYQFWRCRHNGFRGDGAMGQYCIVLPDQDAVIAITSGVKDMQQVMNLVWDKLLPAYGPAAIKSDREAESRLKETLAGLRLRSPEGDADSPESAKLSGKEFVFDSNEDKMESARLEAGSTGKRSALCYRRNGQDQRIEFGFDEWSKGTMVGNDGESQPVAARGAWSDGALTVRYVPYETANYVTVTLRLKEDQLQYDMNIHPNPGKRPTLTGKLKTAEPAAGK